MNKTGGETGPSRHVQIAELKVCGEGLLKATLGSCVGIAVISREPAVCGLVHCLLPKGPVTCASMDGRYVSTALANLLRAMGLEDRQAHPRRHLRAYLAGGARVMGELERPGRARIGEKNLEAARQGLQREGIQFEELETGGEFGCVLEMDCAKREVRCRRLRAMDWSLLGRGERRTR